jgi:TetR/AcrR family transcriptional repressor of mexJK operon
MDKNLGGCGVLKPSESSIRPGRPKDVAKRRAILDAARALFSRKAYDAVTMEEVAARAGVSKMTIYSHFTDKETLFEALVRRESDRMTEAFSMPAGDGGLAERLTALGGLFLRMILERDVACMMSTVPAMLHSHQEAAWRFYEAGPGRTLAGLRAVIAGAAAAGELAIDDPGLAAEDLISLWLGPLPGRMAFGIVASVSPDEVDRRARRGTSVFLRAYQNPATRTGP